MALPSHKPAHFADTTLRVGLRGHALLASPRWNKGTAFPSSERKAFGIEGRLPYSVNSLDEQCARAYEQLKARKAPIRKNTFLQSLKEQNWTLYYALLARHLKELVPVIYTPTEAEAIADYSHLFRRSEGLYLTFPDIDRMEEDYLEQTKGRDIDLIVCSDSEAILGIGDQGVGGIGISTAKSVIYTLIGGLDPAKSLSVVLDVGTNNEKLLNDPLYVGWRSKRVQGLEYDDFIDKFVQLVRRYNPNALLHFEDFGVKNAHRILDRYHDAHAVFNDDIQGTGAVTLACVMAAVGVSRRSRAVAKTASSPTSEQFPIEKDRLADQRYVIFGAGSAGMGIAVQLRDAIVEADGLGREEANRRFWLVDREGLLYHKEEGLVEKDEMRDEFYRPKEEGWGKVAALSQSQSASKSEGIVTLLDVVKNAHPTILIGCSTAAGAFKKEIVEAMVDGLNEGEKPIILPLSNPSRLVEALPEDLVKWTQGQALIATGSPFDAVEFEGEDGKMSFEIAECNNALIYPGLGFGAILSQSRSVTDGMLLAGAKRLASLSPAIIDAKEQGIDEGGDYETEPPVPESYKYNGESLLPDFGDSPRVNFEVAIAVAEQAILEGTARVEWASQPKEGEGLSEDVKKLIREKAGERVWVPFYYDYEFDENGQRE